MDLQSFPRLISGPDKVRMAPIDICKTTFRTHGGPYDM